MHTQEKSAIYHERDCANLARQCRDISDRCVMCGLCLPHCPTYTLERNEAESPRGRIALIKALASSSLTADEALVGRLEHCLQCRRCEAVCPAKVPFGKLMDLAKALLFKRRDVSLTGVPGWLHWLVSSRALRRWVALKIRLYRISGLQWLLRRSGILKAAGLDGLDFLLSAVSALPFRMKQSATRSDRRADRQADRQADRRADRRVALFTGCVAEIFDRETLWASRRLLEAAGVAVDIPPRQTCCGALHQHAGDDAAARRFIAKNAAAFSAESPRVVVSCASGCGAQLKEHESALGIRHFDIHAYLRAHSASLEFMPLERTIALHTPCTMDSCLGEASAVAEMLGRVPGLRIESLPNAGCCGAAGAYMLTQPHIARSLLKRTLESFGKTGAKTLVSSNVGCIVHFRQAFARRGAQVEVTHPATLLARRLPGESV